jgi:hypothetical protein
MEASGNDDRSSQKMKRHRSVSESKQGVKRAHHELVKYTPEEVHTKFSEFIRRVDNHRLSDVCRGSTWESNLWLTWLVEKEGVQDVCLPRTFLTPNLEEVESADSVQSVLHMNQVRDIATVSLTFREVGRDVEVTHVNTVNLAHALRACTQPVAVLFLDLEAEQVTAPGHRGALIFNFEERTYERFEPNSGWFWPGVNRYLDSSAFRTRAGLSEDWTYIPPYHACPSAGPQAVAGRPRNCPQGGYCVLVSTMYIHLRMLMPLNDPEDIVRELLGLEPRRLLNVIRRYATWIHSRTSNESFTFTNDELSRHQVKSLWNQLSELVLPHSETFVAPWNRV